MVQQETVQIASEINNVGIICYLYTDDAVCTDKVMIALVKLPEEVESKIGLDPVKAWAAISRTVPRPTITR